MLSIESVIMNKCRLCHNKIGLHKLNADKTLIKEIYECIRVKVNDATMNSLPQSICEECKKTIKSFHCYKQHIRKVDQKLRELLTSTESKCEKLELTKCIHDEATVQESTTVHEDLPCATCNNNFKDTNEFNTHMCHWEKSVAKFGSKQDISSEKESENTVLHSNSRESEVCKEHNMFSTVCDICNEKFSSNRDLKSHKKMHKMKYTCKWKNCKKILNSAYTLKTHQLIHEGKRSFLCVTCGKGFITKNSLICHEKIHLNVKGYICKLCDIGFSVRSNLRAHEKKYHEGIRFYCSQCTKAFVSKCSLERHERIHTGIREFQCETCPSAFYTNKELRKHQRYHQGLRLHKCDECFKTFFERHHLITHLRSHTGERPYVCKITNCGKSFMESQKLKRHHSAKHSQP